MPLRYQPPTRYLARMWLDVAPKPTTEAVFNETRARLGRADLSMAIGMDGGVQRLALVNRTGLQIVLPGESFDVALIPVVAPDGSDVPMMSFPDFVGQARAILVRLAQAHADRLGRRLALVQEGFLDISGASVAQVAERLFHIPEPFRTHQPFEWDWRLAARIDREFGGVREPVNTLVTIKRASGILSRANSSTPFDRIRLDLDINTQAENTNPRFGVRHIDAFFGACVDWHGELWRQTAVFFPEEH